MSKNRESKEKARRARIRARKHKVGSTHDPNRYRRSKSNYGHLTIDLLKESNQTKINPHNIQFLLDDFKETVDNLININGDFETHCRFTENIYLSKLLIESILNGDFEPINPTDEDRIAYSIFKDKIKEIWIKMDKIAQTLFERKLSGVPKLYLAKSLQDDEVEITKEYMALLPSIYSAVDVGTFSKAARIVVATLGDRYNQDIRLRHYRIREGYCVTEEERKEIERKIAEYQNKVDSKIISQAEPLTIR